MQSIIKPRHPFSALMLSLIPGLGQIYNGQPGKGFLFLAIDFLVPIIFGLIGIVNNLNGLIILVGFSILFLIYRMADGFINAKKRSNYELKAYNKSVVYLLFAIVFVIIRTYLDLPTTTGVQTFKITSPSMHPTMQSGDRVVANLKYYDNNPIQQGDIVVFNAPPGGIWTFRVIGLPNDSIEVKDGKVYVNNTLNDLTIVKEFVLYDQEIIQYQEKLNADKTITTLRYKTEASAEIRNAGKIRIPENEFFLMGDNRDNALDSRFLGTIKKDDILGRVVYSFWGETSERINVDLVNR